ncbi:MAG: hypothetical protein GY909_15185 [Oligoflexia bacterium]|nr:hypothetical protein [Oligoflexia bacterium]
MKKIGLFVTLLLSISINANWSSIFSSTNLKGCGVGATIGYVYSSNANSDLDSLGHAQFAATSCLIGGVIAHFGDKYLESSYAQKEREDKKKLLNTLRQYQRQDAHNTSEDPQGRFYYDYEVVPGKVNPDGSIDFEHLRVIPRKAGSGLLIGD